MSYIPKEYWTERGRDYKKNFQYDNNFKLQEQMLIDWLKKYSFSTVLEVGCGFGRITKLMISNFPKILEYFAFDLSPHQIENAKINIKDSPNSEIVQFSVSDIQSYDSNKKYDLVIYLWETVLPTFSDVKMFKEDGAKIIFLFAGSDIRTFSMFSKIYDVSHWKFPDYWVKEDITGKEKYVEVAEKYADIIYSVPDQAGLQSKPYYHLQIPIELSKFVFTNNRRKIPNVLHLPSDPWKKGTDVIEKAINELITEGVNINFFSYRNLKHDEVPLLLQNMDIVVDQVVFHGPAVLSFEAMASGCAVATRYFEASPACFRPPVWSIDAYNIKGRLAELFNDFELQQRLIVEGRRYVEEHNNSVKVTSDILENLKNPKSPDYKI